jgi:hypothetical protein
MRSQVGFPKNFGANFGANFVEPQYASGGQPSTKFATKFPTKEFCKTGVQLAKAFPIQEVVLLSSDRGKPGETNRPATGNLHSRQFAFISV